MFETASNNDATENSTGASAHILIVDDNLINRKKIRLSVRTLGHETALAENGMVALEKLREEPFDVVLLDLVMPEMDGFDVLKELKSDKQLSHIPVIVVTAYDEQTESVVKAIELGAEDVLPKDFNPVLLKARLDASLNKKRYRDQEIEYFRRVDALTGAAEVIESGRFSGDKLDLDRMAAEPDSLGKLAAVFKGMATEIYNRELKLHRSLHILQGSFLVVLVGVVWGLSPALSRMLSGTGTNPLGLAIWINLIITTCCFSIAAYRRKLPKLKASEVWFFIGWAVIAGVLQRLVTYWVSGHVEAAMISLIVTLQGFIVFAFAAITRLERATPKRLLGLLIGLLGVALVLWSKFDISAMKQNAWLLAATLLPLLFAIEAIVLAGKRPQHIDIFASVGLMTGFSALLLLPLAFFTGSLMSIGPSFGEVELLTLILGIASTASILLAFRLIAVAGSVFYSQCAYTMTLAGIVWGMLLLDETLPAVAWLAFFLIVVGVYLVEPKPSSDDITIKRSFTGNGIETEKNKRAGETTEGKSWASRFAPPVTVAIAAICCVVLINRLVGLSPNSGSGQSIDASNLKTEPLQLRTSGISTVASNKTKAIHATDISQPRDTMDAAPQVSHTQIAQHSGNSESAVEFVAPTSLSDIASNDSSPHHSRNTMSVSLVNAARAESTTAMTHPTIQPLVKNYPAIPELTPRVLTVPTTPLHQQSTLAEDFQFINEDDPFAAIITTSPQSKLLIITPDSLTTRMTLEQGSRLIALAANGEWFHARTESGMAGYIKISDVEIEVMQYIPNSMDSNTP